jgi:hypothetical protein
VPLLLQPLGEPSDVEHEAQLISKNLLKRER